MAFIAGIAFCTNGITIRTAIKDFSCFKQNRYVYAMIRGYLNIGKVDPNVRATLLLAEKAKLLYEDVYINPCVDCNMTPQDQVKQLLNEIKGTKAGGIWVAVSLSDKWHANTAQNCEFANAMVAEIIKGGYPAGIASDAPVWEKVMGNSCEVVGDNVGCWWIKHDKQQSLDHFKPFGGFTFPTIKEFDGPSKMCDQEVDLNFCNC